MVNVVCLTFDQSLCPARNILRVIPLEREAHEPLMSVLAAQRVRLGWLSVPVWKASDARAWLRASQQREPQPPAFQRKPISTLP
jgi:hypothetical protein